MDMLPSVDDAAVERRLRFHQSIDRASRAICGILVIDVGALYLGVVPLALRAYVRPVLVFGVTLLLALEAWRYLGYGQQPGRFRWTRLAIVACMGAVAIGEAVHHIRPSVDVLSERALEVGLTVLAIALAGDLRELLARHS